jgi:hypothetical protein
MRISIDLDDQSCLKAYEVDDVSAYRILPPELSTVHPMCAEARPVELVCPGFVAP